MTMELVDPPGNQVTTLNDKIETYLTVTREGVRVLVISKIGFELSGIRRALATDKRFDFVEVDRGPPRPRARPRRPSSTTSPSSATTSSSSAT